MRPTVLHAVALCVTATVATVLATAPAVSESVVPLNSCADSDNGDPVVTAVALGQVVDVTRGSRRLPVTVSVRDTGGPGPARGVTAVTFAAARQTAGVTRSTNLRHLSGRAWSGWLTIPHGAGLSGRMQLTVSVRDHAGRWTIWYPWDLRDAGLRYRFRVRDGGLLDTAGPQLLGVSITPSRLDTRDRSGVVRFRVRVRDDLSGVDRVTVLRTDGRTQLRRVRGTAADGTWSGAWHVGRWVGSGVRLVQIGVSDSAGNGRLWSAGQLTGRGLDHQVVLRAHTDTSAPTVSVTTTPPAVVEVHDQPSLLPVQVRAVDVGSGTASVAVRLVGQSGLSPASHLSLSGGTRQDGTWAGNLVVPVCMPAPGAYGIQVTAVDRAGLAGRKTYDEPGLLVVGDDTTPPTARNDASQPAPAPLSFSEDVSGVSPSSAAVTTGFGYRSAPVTGTWACSDSAGAAADCLAGPVRRAAFHPSTPLVKDQYVVVLNPDHVLDIRDGAGNPVARTRLSLGTPDV